MNVCRRTFLRQATAFRCLLIHLLCCSACGGGELEATLGGAHHQAPNGLDSSEYAPELGVGVNFSETRTFNRCVVVPGTTVFSEGFRDRFYREVRVQSHEELDKQLGIDADVSMKYAVFKAQSNVSYFSSVGVRSDAAYLLVDARYDLNDERLDTQTGFFQLTDQAATLLREKGIKAFYKACGTHFYTGLRRGARYSLLYEFTSEEQHVVEKLRASLDASGFGSEAHMKLSKMLAFAKTASHIEVYSSIQGGDDKIKRYAWEPSELQSQLDEFARQLYAEKKAPIVEWEVKDYEVIPEVAAALESGDEQLTRVAWFRKSELEYFYRLYNSNLTRNAELMAMLAPLPAAQSAIYVYGEETKKIIRGTIEKLQAQNSEIRRRTKVCLLEAQDCSAQGLLPITDETPKPDVDNSTLRGWSITPVLASSGSRYIGLSGRPPGSRRHLDFETEDRLIETDRGAFARVRGPDGIMREVAIGTFGVVADPQFGVPRVNICMGAFQPRCNLRVIQPTTTGPESFIGTQLQLTIFSEEGFVLERLSFFNRY